MTQCVQEKIGILPAIEAESHFVQVGREMLCRDAMPCSDDAALQEGECRFDSVRVNVAVNVNLRLVLDRLVPICKWGLAESGGIRVQFIGDDNFDILAYVLTDVLRQGSGLHVLGMEETKIAATLPDAHNDLFIGVSVSGLAIGMLLPAKIGFIYFDSAIHHRAIYFFHCGTDAVTEIPCGFVANSDCAFDLIGTHALACFHQEQNCHEPSSQRKMRIIEDRSRRHGELIAALAARKLLARIDPPDSLILAPWALDAIRPTHASENLAAVIVGREQPIQFRECHGRAS